MRPLIFISCHQLPRVVATVKEGRFVTEQRNNETEGTKSETVGAKVATYVLPTAWQRTMTPNLRAQVYVYVAPKKNLKEGVSEVCDIILSVGGSGSVDKFDAVGRER